MATPRINIKNNTKKDFKKYKLFYNDLPLKILSFYPLKKIKFFFPSSVYSESIKSQYSKSKLIAEKNLSKLKKSNIEINILKYLKSVLLGLGLATLFRKACSSRNCLVFKAPSMENIKGRIFGYNDKCYKYEEQNSTCKKTSYTGNTDTGTNTDINGNVVLDMGE